MGKQGQEEEVMLGLRKGVFLFNFKRKKTPPHSRLISSRSRLISSIAAQEVCQCCSGSEALLPRRLWDPAGSCCGGVLQCIFCLIPWPVFGGRATDVSGF